MSPEAADLTDRGVLVRYFLDEAGSGQDITTLTDAIAPGFDLQLTYDSPTSPLWVETPTGRGLAFDRTNGDGGACRIIADKIFGLSGQVAATLETRVQVSNCNVDGSRFLHIGESQRWTFSLGCYEPDLVVFGYNQERDDYTFWRVDLTSPVTLALVFDSARVVPEDRLRLYANGQRQPFASPPQLPQLDEPLQLLASESLCIGNRPIGGRTPSGTISYGALYAVALDDQEVAANVARLAISDDR